MALKDGVVLIRDFTDAQHGTIRKSGLARWSKEDNALRGLATLDYLGFLAGLCKLPLALAEEQARLKQKHAVIEALRTSAEPEPLYPYPVKAKLFQHQIRAANMALVEFGHGQWGASFHGGGFGLLFEMGCGKTLTAVAIMGALNNMRVVRKVLVVAPASVCAVWPKELEAYSEFSFAARVLSGEKKKRLEALAELEGGGGQALHVAVINYESTWRDEVFEQLCSWCPDMIIADESQRIKSPSAAQSKAMHRLGDIATYRLALSGTPVQNNAADLWSQYRFLNLSVFGTNFYAFRGRYAVMGGFENKKIVGYQHMDELVQKEYSIAYRVTKEEALDLPDQVFETRYAVFTDKERRIYDDLRRQSYAELERSGSVTASTVLTKLLRLQQLTGGFLAADEEEKPRVSGKGKLDVVSDVLDDYVIETGHKLVIFARFLPELDALERLMIQKKLKCVRLDGGVPLQDRGELVRQFQEDDETVVFLGQIDTVGLGVTLTAADTAVYYSYNFNYASYSQSLSRIHRLGQKNRCTYIHLAVPDTVDEKILEVLGEKGDLAKAVVDDWRKYF